MGVIKHIKEKYGVYTIIEKLNERAKDGHSLYIGQCECGATKCSTLSNFNLSGKQWASLIPDVGINNINRLMRDKGEKEVVDFIECKLKDKRTS